GTETQRIKAAYAAELSALVGAGLAMEEKILSLEKRVKRGEGKSEKSDAVHRIVGGVMGMIGGLEEGNVDDLSAIKIVCKGDDVISAAIEKVEESMTQGGGHIWTLGELQERWKGVKREGRKMCLAGEGAGSDGLTGVVTGTVMAAIMVETGTEKAIRKKEESCDDEDRLARATHHVTGGDLGSAAAELGKVKGKKVRRVVEGWRKDCETKQAVDEAVKVMKLRASTLSKGVE
ncbi:hypothetical protein TrRE_jg421, partial [Triparma retinervis]